MSREKDKVENDNDANRPLQEASMTQDPAPRSSFILWFEALREKNDESARVLWEENYEDLLRMARRKLGGFSKRHVDEDDVAVSAFRSLFRGLENSKNSWHFEDRNGLRRMLFTIAAAKCAKAVNRERTLKRGQGRLRGHSAVVLPDGADGFDRQPGKSDAPDAELEVMESVEALLELLRPKNGHKNNRLLRVAELKFDDRTNEQIATMLDCSVRSVERSLRMIREIWSAKAPEEVREWIGSGGTEE